MNGGDTSIENCTNINRLAHDYLHSLPREQEEVINDMLREHKKSFKIGTAVITTEGIEQTKQLTFDDFGVNYIEVPLYEDYHEKDYLKHKQDRNRRVYAKFGVDYDQER